ncbi:hypothetical protein [Salmonella phage NINP13076]|nr:hypothetical protein [Salmonella phage NINP13076]
MGGPTNTGKSDIKKAGSFTMLQKSLLQCLVLSVGS